MYGENNDTSIFCYACIKIKESDILFCQNHTIGTDACLFVSVEALHVQPSQQFFSHVGTEPPLPGYYQYHLGGKCILLKDTTQ